MHPPPASDGRITAPPTKLAQQGPEGEDSPGAQASGRGTPTPTALPGAPRDRQAVCSAGHILVSVLRHQPDLPGQEHMPTGRLPC